MGKKKYKAEEIVMILRDIELETGKGLDTAQACRSAGISEQTCYRWRKQYGGMQICICFRTTAVSRPAAGSA